MEKESGVNLKRVFKTRFWELFILSGCPSITQFAAKLGLNRQSVDRYNNGERLPDAPALAQICEKMNVSADWLLGLSETKSVNADVQSVVSFLGLSEEAVTKLKSLLFSKDKTGERTNSLADSFSYMIENERFERFVATYNAFRDLLQTLRYTDHDCDSDDLFVVNWRQTPGGKVIISNDEAIHHFINRASMEFSRICEDEYHKTISARKIKGNPHDLEQLLEEIESEESEIRYHEEYKNYLEKEILPQFADTDSNDTGKEDPTDAE